LNDLSFVERLKKLAEVNINELPITSISFVRGLSTLKSVNLTSTLVVDISPLLDNGTLATITVMRTPARADVLAELERRGVRVNRY
jgi:hypothetical protein